MTDDAYYAVNLSDVVVVAAVVVAVDNAVAGGESSFGCCLRCDNHFENCHLACCFRQEACPSMNHREACVLATKKPAVIWQLCRN